MFKDGFDTPKAASCKNGGLLAFSAVEGRIQSGVGIAAPEAVTALQAIVVLMSKIAELSKKDLYMSLVSST